MNYLLKTLLIAFLLVCSFFVGFYFKGKIAEAEINKEKNKIHKLNIKKIDNKLDFISSDKIEISVNDKALTKSGIILK
ncbi:hypothetical protein M0P65_06365 [Candidatus Gracilibacteria bacterium]|nr:hypothetical protein [Candidatus Gracilibacteria bacterium]